MMADPRRHGQSAGHEPNLTENPEQPEDQVNQQDESLEAQLDALLSELEAVDPQSVPADLRKNTEESEPTPVEPESQAQPVPEPVPQPAPIAAEDTSQADLPPKQELEHESIASMASNMLDKQIEATIEAASGVTESTDTQPQATADEPAPASEPKPSDGLSEDALGDQINALLNDVQAQSTQTEAAPEPEPAPVAEAEPTPEQIPEPAPVQTQPVAATPADTDEGTAESGEPTDAGAISIQQIDAMLAESAEQAIETEPEAGEHVPGTDEILATQAQAEASEVEAQATAASEAQAIEASAEPQPTPEPTPVQSFEAGADDVARELDEDVQPQPVAAEPAPAPAASAVFEAAVEETSQAPAGEARPDETPKPPAVVVDEAGLKKAEHTLLRICGKINRPLYRLSSEMRDLVGWVGVVTLGLGLFMFLFGLIF